MIMVATPDNVKEIKKGQFDDFYSGVIVVNNYTKFLKQFSDIKITVGDLI